MIEVRVPHRGLGMAAAMSVIDTRITVGTVSGRVMLAVADGPDHLLLTLDPDAPAKCPRCGHDGDRDPSRRLDGDHLVLLQGPYGSTPPTYGPDDNTMTLTFTQRVGMGWCSTLPTSMRPSQETP